MVGQSFSWCKCNKRFHSFIWFGSLSHCTFEVDQSSGQCDANTATSSLRALTQESVQYEQQPREEAVSTLLCTHETNAAVQTKIAEGGEKTMCYYGYPDAEWGIAMIQKVSDHIYERKLYVNSSLQIAGQWTIIFTDATWQDRAGQWCPTPIPAPTFNRGVPDLTW